MSETFDFTIGYFSAKEDDPEMVIFQALTPKAKTYVEETWPPEGGAVLGVHPDARITTSCDHEEVGAYLEDEGFAVADARRLS